MSRRNGQAANHIVAAVAALTLVSFCGLHGDAQQGASLATGDRAGLVPLTELGQGRYKGEDGGLYGAGSNSVPARHQALAASQLARITPLDVQGRPDPAGKVVLLSIGMSNTTQEFSRFKTLADADGAKASWVVIVDGAQGGRDASAWADEKRADPATGKTVWDVVDDRLRAAGVTREQVQAVWVKQALAGPARLGQFPEHARQLQSALRAIMNIARRRYPNLRVAYLSSRIYGGYATTALNPEPYAYESAFAVRWLIQEQMEGDMRLNADSARGEVVAPVLLWGPYLWADGISGRSGDGLVWRRDDFGADGTHPSEAGRQKVAEMLLKFFKTDPNARSWFVQPSEG